MSEHPTPYASSSASALTGTITVPGDKSISHRSLMLSSQAIGTSTITGLLEGEDVLRTADALRLLGVSVSKQNDTWSVDGVGVGGFSEPSDVLNMGNAGTGVRLLMGLLGTYPFTSFFTGDASLRSRPMRRVITPLKEFGVQCLTHSGDRLPLALIGTENPMPITYTLPVPSAQVKSAVLLAGLNTPGVTTVIEPTLTRDHTECMLQFFGAKISTEQQDDGKHIAVEGYPSLTAKEIHVPGDPSSAAFPVVAALLVPGSDLLIENICINPTRTGLFQTLKEMGGDLSFENEREMCGEPVADIRVKASTLKGVEVPESRAASMIDEYPVLAVAAAFAEGKTVMKGVGELRVKECDRIAAMAAGLKGLGVKVEEAQDEMIVLGGVGPQVSDAPIVTHLDHRIAMSFLVFGMAASHSTVVDDARVINTSFPGFVDIMNGIGAAMEPYTCSLDKAG